MPSLMAGSWAGEALLGRPDRADEAREGLRCPVRILACSALALCSLASGLAPEQSIGFNLNAFQPIRFQSSQIAWPEMKYQECILPDPMASDS